MKPKNTAILIFENVEVLDFTGPHEVFNVANRVKGGDFFSVYTVSEHGQKLKARNGLSIIPDFSFTDSPQPDILIVPGGDGRKTEMNNKILINWIKEKFQYLEILFSVCTGAFIIGKTGLLKGLKATTHHECYDEFENTFRDVELIKKVKYADNGKIITAGGITSGIDASLHIVGRILGIETAHAAAQRLEYDAGY